MIEVIGIDPGITGGIASYDGKVLTCYALERAKVKAASGRGSDLDWTEVDSIYKMMFAGASHAFIEQVGAMNKKGEQKQGASSVFKFGFVAGNLHGIVVSNGLKPEMVWPQTWKGKMGLVGVGVSKKAKKDKAIATACDLFPDNKSDFFGPRGGGKDGVAEAALIAWYGFHQIREEIV